MNLEFGSSINIKAVCASLLSGSTVCGVIITGDTICSLNTSSQPNVKLTSISAKTTETAIAYLTSDGCIVSGTSTGGGTITGGTNGLGVSGADIKLGGTLTGNTVVDTTGSYCLTLGDTTTNVGKVVIDPLGYLGVAMHANYSNTCMYNAVNVDDGAAIIWACDTVTNAYGSLYVACSSVTVRADNSSGKTTQFCVDPSNALMYSSDSSFKGIEYNDDFSANYTARSLVDKAYVTGLTSSLGTPLTGATNGLTRSGKNIILGGNLTGNTNISLNTKLLNICDTQTLFRVKPTCVVSEVYVGAYDNWVCVDSGQVDIMAYCSTGNKWSQLNLSQGVLQLGFSCCGIVNDATTGTKMGLQYNADYSTGYVARSLADAGYVTGKTATKLNTTIFQTYTGTTAPATYLPYTLTTDWQDPTGFVNGSGVNISYDWSQRKITLTGDLTYYWQGAKKTLTSPWTSSAHSATTGQWFLYSTDGNNITWSQSAWNFSNLMVAMVYYKSTSGATFAIRETHGMMPWSTHQDFHRNVGTYLYSGGLATSWTANTATDSAVSPDFNTATIQDEDLQSTISGITKGNYTLMHISGSTSVYTLGWTTPFSAVTGANYIAVNNTTTGAMTTGIANRWYNVYQILVPSTSDVTSQKYRTIFLQPQVTYTSLASAQAEDTRGLALGSLTSASAEYVLYARITYLTSNINTNYGKVTIPTGGITYVVGSKMGSTSVAGISSSNHATLSNLTWASSGHLGTNNTLAGFDASGNACSSPNMTFDGSALNVTGTICGSTCVCSPTVRATTCAVAPIFVGGGLVATCPTISFQGKIDTTLNYQNYLLFKDEAGTIAFSVANGAASGATNFFPIFNGKVTSTNPALYFVGNSVNGPSTGTGILTFDGRINNAGSTSSGVTVVNFVSGYGNSKARIMADCTFCTNNICASTCVIAPTIVATSRLNILNGSNLGLIAPVGSCDTGDIVFYSGGSTTCEWARIWSDTNGCLNYRTQLGGLTNWTVYHSGNLSGATGTVANLTVGNSICFNSLQSCRFIYGATQAGSCTASTGMTSGETAMYKSGFWEVINAPSMPSCGDWYWGLTAAHTSNGPTYNYSMQLAGQGTGVGQGCNFYLRTFSGGVAQPWRRIYVSGDTVGGGMTWLGSTLGGIGTYVNSSCICSQPNLIFDGSTRALSFSAGGDACLIHAGSSTRALCISSQTGGSQGGCLHLKSGCGSSFGGVIWLCAGSGGTSGGDIQLYPGLGSSSANDGAFKVRSADQVSINAIPRGAVTLAYNGNTKLETTSTSVKICCIPTKGGSDNKVLYTNSGNCVVSGATVDISTNLTTGDLLYYNGSTISGSTFKQNSATNTTFRGDVLLLCSNVNKCINMCNSASYVCALNICGGNTTGATNGCQGGCINIAAGIGCRTSTNTGYIYGGALTLYAGSAYHCYNAIGGYAYGGNVCICAGMACNCYDYPSYGGCVFIYAGSSFVPATCTYTCGGAIYLCAGTGYACGGHIIISAGYSARPTTPAYYGNIYLCRLKSTTCTTCVVIDAAGCISCRPAASDCRLKCNLHEITGMTSLLNTANAYSVEFYNTNTALDGLCQYALIAQDIETQLPLAVKNEAIFNDAEYKVIDYQQIIPVLWSIAKEQQLQICCLQNEINILKNCF